MQAVIRINRSADSGNPKRQAAEVLLARLKQVLETETGRGYVTVQHYLSSRSTADGESEEARQAMFMPRNEPGTGFYEINNVVATGGMGAVLAAKDNNLQRTVALKVMLNTAQATDDAIFRFVAEAQITGQLEHPNIVPLHEIGVAADGTIFYTMKLIEGITMREVLQKIKDGDGEMIARFSLDRLLTIFQKICDGMAYAHSRRVVHRDLKPDNIMIGSFGEVLILDWGLAKVVAEDGQEQAETEEGITDDAAASGGASDGFATMQGQIKGTPNFMAPEQAEGRIKDIDTRTDIYALGAILYNILTLHPPVSGTSVKEILEKVTSSNIALPTVYNTRNEKTGMVKLSPTAPPIAVSPLHHMPDGKIPTALSAMAMKALSLQREDRYQSTDEMQLDIAKYQGGYATSAEHVNPFTAVVMLAKRHKEKVIAGIIVILAMLGVAAGFIGKVMYSEGLAKKAKADAEAQLEKLRGAAPTFYAAAQAQIKERNFTNALDRINTAIELVETNATYHNLKGQVLQSLLLFAEARDEFDKAVTLDPISRFAAENRQLCGKISAEIRASGKTNIPATVYTELWLAMKAQKRDVEGYVMQDRIGASDEAVVEKYRKDLAAAGIKAPLIKDNDRLLHLDLSSTPVKSLVALQGIPLTTLNLSNCVNVDDLSALQDGTKLAVLNLAKTKVIDLRPIKGKPITTLDLANTLVSDLAPLEGMPLTHLTLDGSQVENLAPLKGMKLVELSLFKTKVRFLDALAGMTTMKRLILTDSRVTTDGLKHLKGMKITSLEASGTSITDISVLAGLPISESVNLAGTSVSDLTPLKALRFHELILDKVIQVRDISPLADVPLRRLSLVATQVRDISPVVKMPLHRLNLAQTEVTNLAPLLGLPLDEELILSRLDRLSDISPLKGMPLKVLYLNNTDVSDVSPLQNMPLNTLRLDSCPKLKNVFPLFSCQLLEILSVPFPSPNIESLRQLPNMKQLGYDVPQDTLSRITTKDQFWKQYDAQKR